MEAMGSSQNFQQDKNEDYGKFLHSLKIGYVRNPVESMENS